MASFHEVQDINARSTPKKGAKPEMRSMEYEKSANGGHVFTHRMHQSEGRYIEPETHTFGKEQGKEALAHFAKHAGLEASGPEEDAKETVKGDKDSAAGAAT